MMATEEKKEMSVVEKLKVQLNAKLRLAGVPVSVIERCRIYGEGTSAYIIAPAPNSRSRYNDLKMQEYNRYKNGKFNWKLITLRTKEAAVVIAAREKRNKDREESRKERETKVNAFNKAKEVLNVTETGYHSKPGDVKEISIKDLDKNYVNVELCIDGKDMAKVVKLLRANGIIA
jgi:hypothetical protein